MDQERLECPIVKEKDIGYQISRSTQGRFQGLKDTWVSDFKVNPRQISGSEGHLGIRFQGQPKADFRV